jgi:hypothetical protein
MRRARALTRKSPVLKRPEIAVVIGRGGQGKSFLARHWLAGRERIIAGDPKMEPDMARGRHVASTRRELIDLISARRFSVAWRGYYTMGPDAFEFGNRAALAAGNCTLVWEEVDQFTPRGRLPEAAYQCVNSGRHDGVRVIACARRALRISRDLTASATRIVVFQTTEPNDIRYLEEYIGQDARQARDLPPYHALDWREGHGARVLASPFL